MAETDWYTVLHLAPDATTDDIAQAVEKRSRQAAALANTAPERSQQLREQTRAIKRDLLSGDNARAAYDARRAQVAAAQAAPATVEQADPQYDAAQQQQYHDQQAYYEQQQAYYDQQQWNAQAGQPRQQGRFMKFLQSGWTCWYCGESALPGDKFCTQCSAQLGADGTYTPVATPVQNPNACPYCGALAATTHRFCRSCGAGRT